MRHVKCVCCIVVHGYNVHVLGLSHHRICVSVEPCILGQFCRSETWLRYLSEVSRHKQRQLKARETHSQVVTMVHLLHMHVMASICSNFVKLHCFTLTDPGTVLTHFQQLYTTAARAQCKCPFTQIASRSDMNRWYGCSVICFGIDNESSIML